MTFVDPNLALQEGDVMIYGCNVISIVPFFSLSGTVKILQLIFTCGHLPPFYKGILRPLMGQLIGYSTHFLYFGYS